MKQYKVAIVGCGWIGMGAQLDLLRPHPSSHAEAVAMHERLELVAFIDTDEQSLKHASSLYPQVRQYKEIADLFKVIVPDVIVIATHPDSHCFYIKEAAKAGVKMILSEKPIAHDRKETEEAIAVCGKYGCILLVNHMRRFDAVIKSFKSYINNEYVKDTAIGKVRSVIASYDNGLYHGGTHIVDLMRYLLGEVKAVSAVINHQVASGKDDCNVDAILQFEFGNAALYFFNSKEYALAELSLLGERGCVHFKNMWGIDIEVIGTASSPDYSAYKEPDYKNVRKFGGNRSFMTGTYDHLVNCLDGTEQPLSTGHDALKTLIVLNKIEESAKNGGKQIKIEG